MSARDRITPLILTYNEAPNIARTLDQLGWAKRIVIIDSGSSDETHEIARRYPAVEIVVRPFDNHADQWNFGLAQIRTDWVLSLDADYVLTDAVVEELDRLPLDGPSVGFESAFKYCVYGRRLRASLYPPRVVVFRRDRATHYNDGHTQRLRVDGPTGNLTAPILHDDRKPLSRWLQSQQSYARREADHLESIPPGQATRMQRLRLTGYLGPLAILPYTLFAKGCLFDGWPGWLYALQRTTAETMIALELVDRRTRRRLLDGGSH